LISQHNIFKRLRSDNPNERETAAHKLYESFVADGGHPDDWEIRKKGTKASRSKGGLNDAMWEARYNTSQLNRDLEEVLRKNAEERRDEAQQEAKLEREARDKADAEVAKLREQLSKAKARAKAAPDPTERVDLLSALLSQESVNKLSAEQIGEKMKTLFSERDVRQYNVTGQVDLVIGQLTDALYQRHVALFGKRKRGSNAPTVSEFLETHAGKSASWCRRCFKAYTYVTDEGWTAEDWDGTGGIEGINKQMATFPLEPKKKRVNKTQQKLDALADVVRRREWEYAERMVCDWDADH
jgi:hypothetical protein